MRKQPTWRIPAGILLLVICLVLYAGLVAQAADHISALPVLLQVPVYVVLGTIWLLPLRRFLIWMETGRFG